MKTATYGSPRSKPTSSYFIQAQDAIEVNLRSRCRRAAHGNHSSPLRQYLTCGFRLAARSADATIRKHSLMKVGYA